VTQPAMNHCCSGLRVSPLAGAPQAEELIKPRPDKLPSHQGVLA